MNYIDQVIEDTRRRYPHEEEYINTVREILGSLEELIKDKEDYYRENAVLERLINPERIISFRVAWTDDQGQVQVNTGYRVQHSSLLGPYKGGLRFHPSVNQSIIKFLALEQTFKNSLTGLKLGGAKGGSDFDPKNKSDREIMNFCQAFITELSRHIGPYTDVPAGDMGVGKREIGYMFGQYRKIRNQYSGVLTGKDLAYGGSLIRMESTGYGIIYLTDEILKHHKMSLEGKTILVSGSGNVALHTIEKAIELKAKVVSASDSQGFIYDPKGIDIDLLKDIKVNKRMRISEYAKLREGSSYFPGEKPWRLKADLVIPCATQNEIDLDDVKMILDNGCLALIEGSNGPSSLEALNYLKDKDIIFVPSKAANAGGVATSLFEMSQNAQLLGWTSEMVDERLEATMRNIARNIITSNEKYAYDKNYMVGTNIFAFERLVDSLLKQGVI